MVNTCAVLHDEGLESGRWLSPEHEIKVDDIGQTLKLEVTKVAPNFLGFQCERCLPHLSTGPTGPTHPAPPLAAHLELGGSSLLAPASFSHTLTFESSQQHSSCAEGNSLPSTGRSRIALADKERADFKFTHTQGQHDALTCNGCQTVSTTVAEWLQSQDQDQGIIIIIIIIIRWDGEGDGELALELHLHLSCMFGTCTSGLAVTVSVHRAAAAEVIYPPVSQPTCRSWLRSCEPDEGCWPGRHGTETKLGIHPSETPPPAKFTGQSSWADKRLIPKLSVCRWTWHTGTRSSTCGAQLVLRSRASQDNTAMFAVDATHTRRAARQIDGTTQ